MKIAGIQITQRAAVDGRGCPVQAQLIGGGERGVGCTATGSIAPGRGAGFETGKALQRDRTAQRVLAQCGVDGGGVDDQPVRCRCINAQGIPARTARGFATGAEGVRYGGEPGPVVRMRCFPTHECPEERGHEEAAQRALRLRSVALVCGGIGAAVTIRRRAVNRPVV